MSEAPKVSAIIVNWNGTHHLRICLPSLLEQICKSLEIIVVDNGSSDDSVEVARGFGVRWLPLGANIGLAPALNRGARVANGENLLFVNNDMRFDPNFVGTLVRALEARSTIFAADGMQFNWDGSMRVHMATRLTKENPRGASRPELVPGLYFYPQERSDVARVFMGSAACILVRRTLFDELGGFDDRLPLGYEDVDLCWRAWLHGWESVFVPEAICWHRVGASGRSEEGARFSFRGVLTGRLLFATKLLPTRYAVRTWLVSAAALGRDLIKFRWRIAGDRISILRRLTILVPTLLREKESMFRKAGRSPEEHLRFLLNLTREGS